jgi:hypothetical protein
MFIEFLLIHFNSSQTDTPPLIPYKSGTPAVAVMVKGCQKALMFFLISFPNFVSGLTVIVSTPRAVLSNVPNRRGGIVPNYKSNLESEKARRVFVLVRRTLQPSNDDRDNRTNHSYIVSFRIADIMEVPYLFLSQTKKHYPIKTG